MAEVADKPTSDVNNSKKTLPEDILADGLIGILQPTVEEVDERVKAVR